MKNFTCCLSVAIVTALLLSSCKSETELRPPKNIEDLGPIKTREGEENIPYSYSWSGHESVQINDLRYNIYPSGDLNIKGEKGVDYRYFVFTADIQPPQMKVFDILTDMEIDHVAVIEQFLIDPNQVGHDFKGTIVVSLANTLEVEQAKIYNNGVATDYGYGFQIRKDIEEQGLVTSEQEDVIELRNYAYCSDFYLVIYELDTGNIISYTFLYTICHGTGPGSDGGSSGSSSNDEDDWGIHDDDGDEDCSWVHTIGYFEQQRTLWDLFSDLSIFPGPNSTYIHPIHISNLGGFCKLVGVTTYSGNCSWQTNVATQNGTQASVCGCIAPANTSGTSYRFGPRTVRTSYNGNASNVCSSTISIGIGSNIGGTILFNLDLSSNDQVFFNETFTNTYNQDSICYYDCEG